MPLRSNLGNRGSLTALTGFSLWIRWASSWAHNHRGRQSWSNCWSCSNSCLLMSRCSFALSSTPASPSLPILENRGMITDPGPWSPCPNWSLSTWLSLLSPTFSSPQWVPGHSQVLSEELILCTRSALPEFSGPLSLPHRTPSSLPHPAPNPSWWMGYDG